MPTIKPLDIEAIVQASQQTGRIITVENHSRLGGLGGAVAETLTEHAPCRLQRLGFPDVFGESGDDEAIFSKMGVNTESIFAAGLAMAKSNEDYARIGVVSESRNLRWGQELSGTTWRANGTNRPAGYFNVENPSTGDVIAQTPLSTAAEANRAVEAAAEAFGRWRNMPAGRRVQPLLHLTALLRHNEEPLARQITEEMGKSLPDSRAEVKRAIENCEVACGMPVLQQGDKLVGASFGIDGEVLRLPLGVFALAGPFNFPCMVPFWFFPYAIRLATLSL